MKVGDLVYVAKVLPCCGSDKCLGITFVVAGFREPRGSCRTCGKTLDLEVAMHSDGSGIYASTLRIIPPLSDLEDTAAGMSADIAAGVPVGIPERVSGPVEPLEPTKEHA